MSDSSEAAVTADTAGATATLTEGEATAGYKMSLEVDISNVGPCRKHVRVKVPQADIDHFREEALEEVAGTASVPGFRPGRVPTKLVEKRFKKELTDQVRQRVLLTSLEQLASDNALDPINEPDFEVESLILPEQGDFEYEFDVEVRPDFELPNYVGLTLQRPSRETTDADVDQHLERFLMQYGTQEDKSEPAALGDYVKVDIEFLKNGELIRRMNSLTLELRPKLQFPDGELPNFGDLLVGSTTDTVKETELTIAPEASNIEMRGEVVQVRFTVKGVSSKKLPELTKEFLSALEVEDEAELKVQARGTLQRQLQFEQRQSARKQVLEKITESANWELPEELVRKQVENAMRREILEMQQAGFTTQEIRNREASLRQRSISTTRQALKEHFVLDKIATKESIECSAPDIESEIYMMALQRGENPRRVRARLQKSGMIENLEAQIRERKAVDFVLKSAVYEDIAAEAPVANQVESVSMPICGGGSAIEQEDADESSEE